VRTKVLPLLGLAYISPTRSAFTLQKRFQQ